MKKYHIFESLFLSFYSKSLYRDVAAAWQGLGMLYLLLVLAICWLPFSYDFQRFLNQISSQLLPKIIEQMPTIFINQGKLSIDRPVPYSVQLPGNGATLVVFDTSGRFTSLEKLSAIMLITQDKIIVRSTDSGSIQTYPMAKLKDGKVTRSQFREYANKIVFLSSILMYPLSVLVSFLYRFLQVLVLGLVGLLIAYLCRVKITYKMSVRLAVVAFTPMLFIVTLIEYFSWPVPFLWLVSLLLIFGYLVFAIRAQRD